MPCFANGYFPALLVNAAFAKFAKRFRAMKRNENSLCSSIIVYVLSRCNAFSDLYYETY